MGMGERGQVGTRISAEEYMRCVMAPKRVTSRRPRVSTRGLNVEVDLAIEWAGGGPGRFTTYVRQQTDLMEKFSVGLRWEMPRRGDVHIVRVNGQHGPHQNPDGSVVADCMHAHYWRLAEPPLMDRQPKWAVALPGNRRCNVAGAWDALCAIANISCDPTIDRVVNDLLKQASQTDLPF